VEGYPERFHGGVTATILNGAMRYCLFVRRMTAVTGALTVRHPRPVSTREPVETRAWIECSAHDVHRMGSELRQGGGVVIIATATFVPGP